eukprot:CAMPEP_0202970432 /NCGR_PEP_ID=MMETSP1396-20130829/16756_1 /ASSEMBLY_ACC=CAM_ASM_000872 /TAXON_ID= /ORGANISM="Pseudokeronopsis sp., Strain Brazil" /LENGTH=31 /DNA_ID= /DNA_START= /DNA_END= /DNA_ORIENTATION=
MVIVGAGNIDHDAFVEQVNQNFAALPKQSGG